MRKPNQQYYYYNSIRNQVIVFMSLFRNMKVIDIDEDNGTLGEEKVSNIDIIYAPQERKNIDLEYEKLYPDSLYDMKVPMFSVSIDPTITYDSNRALNFYRTRRIKQNSKQYQDRMPVPYDIPVTLSILAKYEGHLNQIAENIVPFMTPYIIVRIKENIDFLTDVPRELRIDFDGNFNRDVTLEWTDTERRIIKGSMNFIIKGWIYKPIDRQPGPILHIPIKFFKTEDFDEDIDLFDQTEVYGPSWYT